MSPKKVTVLIPNYNHLELLKKALASFFNQTRLPDQIIVCDDASTDGSLAYLKDMEKQQPLLRVMSNETNLGPVHTINKLMQAANTEFCYPFPADDYVQPRCLELLMSMLEKHPQAKMCCADYIMVQDQSKVVEHYRGQFGQDAHFFDPQKFAEALKGWWLPSFTCVFSRKEALAAGDFLNPDLKWHCDWFSYHCMAFRHGVCYVPEVVAVRRRHFDSYASNNRSRRQEQESLLRKLLALLISPENQDVLPFFVRSGAMIFFNKELSLLVMSDSKFWSDPKIMMLAQLPLWYRMQECRDNIARIWDNRII